MEYQQAVVRAPRMSRINWTQTTTVTIAAFVGCLAAIVVLVFAYQSFLGKTLKNRTAKLDRIDAQIDESENELISLRRAIDSIPNSITRKPKLATPNPAHAVVDFDDDKSNTIEIDPTVGDKVATTPTV